VSVASSINVNTPVESSKPKKPAFAPLLLYLNLTPLSKLSSLESSPIVKIGSATSTVVEFVIVCVPVTVKLPLIVTVSAVISSDKKLPVTLRLLPIVTSSGKLICTWLSVTAVAISLAVPTNANVSVPTVTVSVLLPSPIVNTLEVAAVLTAVTLPFASTVITGIALELP